MIAERTLQMLTENAAGFEGVRKNDLRCGDWLIVDTKNSSYSILALGGDRYCVSGGWFDRQGLSPATLTINGCTWGGSAIKTDVVAGPGCCLEFGNRVTTTKIRRVRVIRTEGLRSDN